MRAHTTALLTVALLALVVSASARASFGLNGFDVAFTNADGSPATQAGSHPFAMTTSFHLNTKSDPEFGVIPDGEIKDLTVEQMAGLVGAPSAVPRCSTTDFLTTSASGLKNTSCPDSTAVGIVSVVILDAKRQGVLHPVYNLVPPPGVAVKLGFVVLASPVTIEIGVKHEYPYNVSAVLVNIPQTVEFFGSTLTLWGEPADPAHDPYRGNCLAEGTELKSEGDCHTNVPDIDRKSVV